jgi:hypothetical protein
MPKPVHYSRSIHFDFAAEAVLQRPKLAAYITSISNSWNEIDARLSVFLAALLGTEATTVITIFVALKADAAKRAAVDAIASLKLNEDQQKTFEKIMITLGKRYDERNKAIHGAWNISNSYPNDLLWADIRETTILAVELMKLNAAGNEPGQHEAVLRQQKKILVYNENDFIDIHNRMVEAYSELDAFVSPFTNQAFGQAFSSVSKSPLPKV